MNSWHFFVHLIGADYGADYGEWVWENFWSGFGADLGLFGAVISVYLKHICHTSNCYRIGRHVIDGTPWCNRHHEAIRQAKEPG